MRQHNIKMSDYPLKQLCSQILLTELKNCTCNIIIGFQISFTQKICSIKIVNDEKIRIIINLNYIKKSIPDIKCSLLPKVYYCCSFIVQYVKQLELVKQEFPKSYFEGLTYFNAIENYKQKRKINVYSPIFLLCNNNKRSYCMSPIEVLCAIKAIEKIVIMEQLEWNDKDKKTLNAFKETLLQYSYFPEISYAKKRLPVYTVINSLKEIAKLIEKEPSMLNEFPILTLGSFHRIKEMSLKDFFLFCAESNNVFLMGIAIRLISYLNFEYKLDYKNTKYEEFIKEIKKYIFIYTEFHGKIFIQESFFVQDNLFAVKKVVQKMNYFMSMNGITLLSNNIHIIL